MSAVAASWLGSLRIGVGQLGVQLTWQTAFLHKALGLTPNGGINYGICILEEETESGSRPA